MKKQFLIAVDIDTENPFGKTQGGLIRNPKNGDFVGVVTLRADAEMLPDGKPMTPYHVALHELGHVMAQAFEQPAAMQARAEMDKKQQTMADVANNTTYQKRATPATMLAEEVEAWDAAAAMLPEQSALFTEERRHAIESYEIAKLRGELLNFLTAMEKSERSQPHDSTPVFANHLPE